MSSLPIPAAATAEASRPVVCRLRMFGSEVVIPPLAHTLAGFRSWARSQDFPAQGRISFLDGELVVDMSPEELNTHNKVKTEITRVVATLNKELELGEVFSDRSLLTNEAAGLSTEPDALFATWDTLQSGRLRLIAFEHDQEQAKELQGRPDWVLEIVSDSSVAKDTRELLELYHRAGIPEYWLIDARGPTISFQVLRHAKDGYEEVVAARGGWLVSTIFQRRFRLTRKRNRIQAWTYTLEMKPLR